MERYVFHALEADLPKRERGNNKCLGFRALGFGYEVQGLGVLGLSDLVLGFPKELR